LIFGFFTRLAAFATLGSFLGVLFAIHIHNGFFMNWNMEPNKGEGYEYFILLFGLALIALIAGGGKASVDAAIAKKN
jgi:putative oxidoreductase